MENDNLCFKNHLRSGIKLYRLIGRLLTSSGYSFENKLQPDEFTDFLEKAEKEHGTTYQTIETMINDPNNEVSQSSLTSKLIKDAADVYCWPLETMVALPEKILATVKNKMVAYVVTVGLSQAIIFASIYADLKLNTFPAILFGTAAYFATSCIVHLIKSGWSPLIKYSTDLEIQDLFLQAAEAERLVNLKVHPDYNFKQYIFEYMQKDNLRNI